MPEGRLFIRRISLCWGAPLGAATARLYGALALIQSSVFSVTHFCVTQKCVMNNPF